LVSPFLKFLLPSSGAQFWRGRKSLWAQKDSALAGL
jgi:hypothetical protein